MGLSLISIGRALPKVKVTNDDLRERYGEIVDQVSSVFRRETRYHCADDENVLTLAEQSVRNCLADVDQDIIDNIGSMIFVTDTPEFNIPTNAIMLRERLGLKPKYVHDVNCNCIGMAVAIDEAEAFIEKHKDFKYVLIVGAEASSKVVNPNEPILPIVAGDASVAMLFEYSEEHTSVLASDYYTDSSECNVMKYPIEGVSEMFKDESKKYFTLTESDITKIPPIWVNLLTSVLTKTGKCIEDIDHFVFSQFCYAPVKMTLDMLCVEDTPDRHTYVGQDVGYTANTSPYYALSEAMRLERVKKGDLVAVITLGAGSIYTAQLFNL